MNQVQYQYRAPQHVVSRNGHAPAQLGQINLSLADPIGRENVMKVTSAVALGGGAAYAFLSMISASKKNKAALGALGGGLAATALLSLIDGLS